MECEGDVIIGVPDGARENGTLGMVLYMLLRGLSHQNNCNNKSLNYVGLKHYTHTNSIITKKVESYF